MMKFCADQITYLLVAVVAAVMLSGCQKYGEVSPQTYEFAKALYSVCNRKDDGRLQSTETAIQEAVKSGELPEGQAGDLLEIIETARSGNWTTAMQDCRTMMSEQNGRH